MKGTLITIVAKSAASDDAIEKRWHFSRSARGKFMRLDVLSKTACYALSTPAKLVLDTRAFFSADWYTWLPENIPTEISVELRGATNFCCQEFFAYITHIGALLVAVDSGDALLAAEIFNRRASIFCEYEDVTIGIIKPIAAEALFSWIYGGFCSEAENEINALLKSEEPQNKKTITITEIFFKAAKEKLQPKPDDTARSMMIRYFQNNKDVSVTMELVGTQFSSWLDNNLINFEKRIKRQESKDFATGTQKAASVRNRIFSSTKADIQAEPQNPFDPNALGVYLDDIQSRAFGLYAQKKAGYIRKTGAAIIRTARPEKLSFKASLARLGTTYGEKKIVIKMEI